MIFYLLRSIRSERLARDRFGKSKVDTLEIIIKWLQVGVSDCIQQTVKLKSKFVSRDLVPSDRATYTIASRVNFFDTKLKALSQL